MRNYIDEDFLREMSGVLIATRQRSMGMISGMHRASIRGGAIEFMGYRKYVLGDDTRQLDWKAYARSDRYYIKEREADTNLAVLSVIDVSGSMGFHSMSAQESKYVRACRMAISLSSLVIRQGDSAGLCLAGEGEDGLPFKIYMSPARRPTYLHVMEEQMELVEPAGATTVTKALHILAEKVRPGSLIIVFSDLYEDSEQFISSLKHAAVKKLDVIVIHMIDQAEFLLNDIEGQIRFVDMETQQSTMTDVQFIREEYRRLMQKFIDDCSAYCLSSGMGYCVVSGEQLWQNVLTEFLASYFTRNP